MVLGGVFVLYLLSSPETLKYAVDRATQNLDIEYDTISGNFLKTLTLSNLKYKGKLLAKEAEIDWNIRALLKADLEIETLSLKFVDFKTIEALLQHASNNQPKEKETNKSLSLPDISVSHLYISTLPHHTPYINLHTFELDVYDVNAKTLDIKEFSIKTTNNLFSLDTKGSLNEKHLSLEKLNVENIEISNIEKALALFSTEGENNSTFMPVQDIDIHHLKASINPYTYDTYEINNTIMTATHLSGDILALLFNVENLALKTNTNLATLSLHGDILQNRFMGNAQLNLSQAYFQKFTNIIDFKSLNPIKTEIVADQEQIEANISLSSKQLFAGRYKNYLTAINALQTQVHYNLKDKSLKATTDANVSSKYARTMVLKDTLTYTDKLRYGGTIAIAGLEGFPEYSLPLFDDALIDYHGDKKELIANLQTDKLHLLYKMFDFERADFYLDSKALEIVKYFPDIPSFLHPLKASAKGVMHLDFNNTNTLNIESNISSNMLHIVGNTQIKNGKVFAQTKVSLTEDNFLSNIDKNIKFKNIFPGDLNISYHDSLLQLDLDSKNGLFQDAFSYDINHSYVDNRLDLKSALVQVKGEKNNLRLQAQTDSLKTLQETLAPLYDFEKRPYDGAVDINATIQNFATISAEINSPWLVYEYTLNRFAFAEKIKLQLQTKGNQLTLNHYTFHTFLDYDREFHALKPSLFSWQGKTLSIEHFWVNDQLTSSGKYNFQTDKGSLDTSSDNYHYKGKEGDITFRTNLHTTLSKNNTHIAGNIDVLEGVIKYQNRNTHNRSDPDIIIIQEEKERLEREKAKSTNLSLDISLTSQKPLEYQVPKIEASVTPDIKFWKEPQKSLEVLGRTSINGGTYTEGDKVFEVLPGEILFGGDLFNPYLNIRAKHHNDPYVIDIDITGNLDSPVINFSSNPYLSQSDILSILLFSSTTESLFEGKSNSSNKAISILGNTFAKEIVKNFGLTLDKLVISTNEEGGLGIEVGKKVSKRITVIYINDIVQSLKVRYQHSNHFETDFMISPEATGIDFLYKSEH